MNGKEKWMLRSAIDMKMGVIKDELSNVKKELLRKEMEIDEAARAVDRSRERVTVCENELSGLECEKTRLLAAKREHEDALVLCGKLLHDVPYTEEDEEDD